MSTRAIPILAFSSIIVFVLLFALIVTAEPSTQQQKDDEGGDDLPFWPTATSTPRPTSTPTSTRCWGAGPQCPVSTNTPRPATATPAPTSCYGPGPQCTYPTNTPRPATATPHPTATDTPVPPTPTDTPEPTATATATPRPTPRPTSTPRPTDTPTIVVSLRPPSLRVAVYTRRVSLAWDLVTGATDYELHYRKGNVGWTTRSVATQSSTGQAHISNLISNRDYEFQIRAASAGRNASATWGAWSASYFARTGPPFPPDVAVTDFTHNSFTLSLPNRNGVASNEVRYALVSSGELDWQPSVTTSATSYTIPDLTPRTRYYLAVRAHGDGSKYTTGAATWSSPSLATTRYAYAALIPAPSRAYMCRWDFTPYTASSLPTTLEDDDGGTHVVRSEIFVARRTYPNNGDWCVEARFISESTPGATESTWSGKVYATESKIRIQNMAALAGRDIDGFLELYKPVAPDITKSADSYISHTCPLCRGGTKQTSDLAVTGRILKNPSIYAYGTHAFTSAGWSDLATTTATVPLPPTFDASASLMEHDPNIGRLYSELEEDLTGELLSSVWTWLQQQLGGE